MRPGLLEKPIVVALVVASLAFAGAATARADEIIYLRTLGGSAAVSAAVQAEAEALIE